MQRCKACASSEPKAGAAPATVGGEQGWRSSEHMAPAHEVAPIGCKDASHGFGIFLSPLGKQPGKDSHAMTRKPGDLP